jgi:general L-amino acid transport system permease protein
MAAVARFVRELPTPALPPPLTALGPIAWARANLFSSVASSLVTIALIALTLWLLPPLIGWATWQAIWSAPDGALCRANQDGACWAFIAQKSSYLLFGSYPESEHWRVTLAEALGAVLIGWLLWAGAPRKGLAAVLFFFVYPLVAFLLLHGSTTLGLPIVDTILWGGVFVSLLVSLVGIVFSLPLGVLLALGRRSRQPVIKALSIIFIEVVRGVPFITVLFMANNLLPLFVPDDYAPDRFLRPLVGTALFAAAYLAEEVRGGLQTLPKGQYEAAAAIGLGYWRMMGLVVLPQALTLVIPGIVNNFIGLFKDTTLVSIVGMTDFLGAMDNAMKDTVWSGPTILVTGYAFAGLFYYVVCAAMSRYARATERRLQAGRNR